jgi:subtilisin family serine protease
MNSTLLAAAFLVYWALPALGAPPKKPVKSLVAPKNLVATTDEDAAATPQMKKALAELGWKEEKDGGLARVDPADKTKISIGVLQNASFFWKKGSLVYDKVFFPIEADKLGPILQGLADFSSAAALDAKKVGATVSSWGIPPAFDGSPILNPDGSASYYGLMLYQYYVKSPDALKVLSDERLAEGLERIADAYDQAFTHQAPDIAHQELELAWDILGAPMSASEKPLGLQPYPDLGKMLAKYRSALDFDSRSRTAAADPAVRAEDSQALKVLKKLEAQKYAADKTIVPPPDTTDAEAKPSGPALSTGLPGLLKALDRVNGKPLTAAEQRALIESFPMGELVWRLGAQNLWRRGFTGKGMKMAVIDGGVAPDAELEGAVVRDPKNNFSTDRGAALIDEHGTHVAGIMHQLAPDATITSYIYGPSDSGNPKLKEGDEGQETAEEIMSALRKAVADGNTVVNLSAGFAASPNNPISRLVDELSRKGVMFVISAGNEAGENDVDSPANAPGAITAGSLNVDDRISQFSSFGVNFDSGRGRTKYVVKDVFLVPGQNIRSTMPDDKYETMSGTSMASPALAAVVGLLSQAAACEGLNPGDASRRIVRALIASATPPVTLPPDASLAQHFYIVDPTKALDALQSPTNPVAGK